jgi:DNA-binding transcriptional ArsR family regulator
MSEDTAPFPEVDRIVHEPARLAIMTVLSSCRSADFLFLQSITGLSKGNLSVQISRLEEARLVIVEKSIVKKKTLTRISLTGQGIKVMELYWKTMDQIRKQSRFKAQR